MQESRIKQFLLKEVPKHPHDLVAITMATFSVTRTTVHRHITTLIEQKKLIKSGNTRQIAYYLADSPIKSFKFDISAKLSEQVVWLNSVQPDTKAYDHHIIDILHYGFTEVFNNAIEHSEGQSIELALSKKEQSIVLSICDNGLGLFEKLCRYFKFETYRDSLLHMTKGRLTTDPTNHAGEGLFFTSRAFDEFTLEANQIKYYRNNIINDWALLSTEPTIGTKVTLTLNNQSNRKLVSIFNPYSSNEQYEFIKTDLLVPLSLYEGERLMSRAQGKRLVAHLEPFAFITLDFKHVRTVGQGFVDEIFRVFQNKRPDLRINYINANDDIVFMIKRAI